MLVASTHTLLNNQKKLSFKKKFVVYDPQFAV